MKKKVTTFLLLAALLVQSVLAIPAVEVHAGIEETVGNTYGRSLKLKGFRLVPPDGKTMDAVQAGDTVQVEVDVRLEAEDKDSSILLDEKDIELECYYTPEDENGSKAPDVLVYNAASSSVRLYPNEETTLKFNIETEKSWCTGKVTFKKIYFGAHMFIGQFDEGPFDYRYQLEDGKLKQYNNGVLGEVTDYDGSMDFTVKQSDDSVVQKPEIKGLKQISAATIHSGDEIQYEIDYVDNSGGNTDAELLFVKGDKEFSITEKLATGGSGNKTDILSGQPKISEDTIGTWKLKRVALRNSGKNADVYTLNSAGTALENDAGKTLSTSTVTIAYMTKGLQVSDVTFIDEKGASTNLYYTKQEVEIAFTLCNTTSEDIEINSGNVWANLVEDGTMNEWQLRGKNGRLTLKPGEKETIYLYLYSSSCTEGRYHLKNLYIKPTGGTVNVVELRADLKGMSLYQGNLMESSKDLSNMKFEMKDSVTSDEEAPYLESLSFRDDTVKISDGEVVALNLKFDSDRMGGALPQKAKVELYDVENPEKNIFTNRENSTSLDVVDEKDGRWTLYFYADSNSTSSGKYRIRSITLTDENSNTRTYKLCDNGKLGEGATGVIDNAEVTLYNSKEVDTDYDAPVLKSATFVKIEQRGRQYIKPVLDIVDDSGADMEIYVTDGKETAKLSPFSWDSDDRLIYSTEECPHGELTLERVVLTDRSCRENQKIYTYDAKSKALVFQTEHIAVTGSATVENHSYEDTVIPATVDADGAYAVICKEAGCSYKFVENTIARPKEVILSQESFASDGKVHCPQVEEVRDSDGVYVPEDHYTVEYPKNTKEPGTYNIIIRFTGEIYSGTMTATYVIVDMDGDIDLQYIYMRDYVPDDNDVVTFGMNVGSKTPLSRIDVRYTYPNGKHYTVSTQIGADEREVEEDYVFYNIEQNVGSLPGGESIIDQIVLYDGDKNKNGLVYVRREGDGPLIRYYNDDYRKYADGDEKMCLHVHEKKTSIKKASPGKNGYTQTTCSSCDEINQKKTIYAPEKIKLSATGYTYDGKEKKPSVQVIGADGKTISISDYTVSYSGGRKNVGRYTVTVTFNSMRYTGTMSATYDIAPKATSLSSLSAGKKYLTAKWKKQSTQTDGYSVSYSTSASFKSKVKTVTVSGNKTISKKITKLSSKKKYYVRVRTYKKVKVQGKTVSLYSKWSGVKSVKVK